MSDIIKEFKNSVISKIPEVLSQDTINILEETNNRSEMRTATFKVGSETYKLLEQNKKKASKFAACAKNHEVFWLINETDGQWFLIVDGEWYPKSAVTLDGTLLTEQAI